MSLSARCVYPTPEKCLTPLRPPVLPVQYFFFNHSQTLTLQRNKYLQILSASTSQLQNPHHSHLLQLPAAQHNSSSPSHPTVKIQWSLKGMPLTSCPCQASCWGTVGWDPVEPTTAGKQRAVSPTISTSACPQAGSDPPSLFGQGTHSSCAPPAAGSLITSKHSGIC